MMLQRLGTISCLLTSILVSWRLWSDPGALIWFEKLFVTFALFYATLSLYGQDLRREREQLRAEAHHGGVARS